MVTRPAKPRLRRILRWLDDRRAEHERVLAEFTHLNLGRLRLGAVVLVVVNVIHVAMFALARAAPGEHPLWRRTILVTHLVMAVMMTCLGVASHLSIRAGRRGRLERALVLLSAASLLLFGVVLAVADQWVTPSITPIVVTGICIGIVFLLRPGAAIPLFAADGLFSAVALGFTQHDQALLLSNRVNVLTSVSIGGFLSIVLWRTSTSNALLQRALQESHAELDRKREELSQLNRELEAKVDQKAAELLSRSEQVEVLVSQLRQRVHDRSRELATALARMKAKERPTVGAGSLLGGRVRLLSLLGSGGMGAVFVGEDLVTGEHVAVKIILREDDMSEAALQRFLRESRAAARVEHQAVARMIHVDVSAEGVLFQVQELVDGASLSAVLAGPEGPPTLAQGEVARLGAELAAALRAAHAAGVIHRDIKPGNVMLSRAAPGLKLLDFGIAKVTESEDAAVSSTHEILGTPEYMAPEQILTPGLVDDRADVYALGLLLYRLLTGQGPFGARSAGEYLHAHVVSPPEALPGTVSPALATLVLRCLAKDARLRPSAFEVATLLRAFADEAGAPPLEVISRRLLLRTVPGQHAPDTEPTR